MDSSQKVNLIDGSFTTEEANEILMSVFYAKIHFHEMKNFSSQIRFGKDDEIAVARIPKLKKETEKMLQILAEAKSKNKKLLITADINISLQED